MITTCPSDDVLSRYAIGDIDDAQADEVQQHLASCAVCEESVSKFDSVSDSLTRHLPLVAAGDVSATDRPAWIEQLRNGPPTATPANHQLPSPVDVAGPIAEFSSYELLGILGRGGMGVVYRARHRQLGRQVALKVLNPRLTATVEAQRRFEREIKVLGGLHHPGIVMATDANRAGGAAYLVMELVDGVDMSRMVRQGGPLSIAETCEAARQMAEALAVAHQAGTIHRDVKPSNVMVDRQGRVKLLDFGLAHLAAISTESLETSVGHLLGTLDYMAPEQADTDHPLDARADLFSLGATMFFLLTGRPPHGSHSNRTLMHQLKALAVGEAPRVGTLRAGVPPELDDFIAKLLSRDPAQRPASAEIVAAELANWAGGDLSTRVTELLTRNDESETASNDSEVARRSLSELLHAEESDSKQETSPRPTASARRWWLKAIGFAAGAAAAIAAIVYGVVIYIQTGEGTFKVESEVGDVHVEMVNDKAETQELQIHKGTNESKFRAGKYQVRIAGEHDGIKIDKDIITLERGNETLARITRIPKEKAGGWNDLKDDMRRIEGVPTAPNTAAKITKITKERLYQGKSESEWQRLFKAETDPTSKMLAAKALISLSAGLSQDEQLSRILDVGEEHARASYGSESIEFAFAPGGLTNRPQNFGGGFGGGSNDPFHIQAVELNSQLFEILRKFPDTKLAEVLSKTVHDANAPRASFAASLMTQMLLLLIRNGDGAPVVLRELDVALDETPRSRLCLLVRARFIKKATPDQKQQICRQLGELAAQLQGASEGTPGELLATELLNIVRPQPFEKSHVEWPAETRQGIAKLLLGRCLRQSPQRGFGGTPLFPVVDPRIPYDANQYQRLRTETAYYADQWLAVVNEYLEQSSKKPLEPALQVVISSLEPVLLVYSQEDDWPADKTADLLTELLHSYYTDDRNKAAGKPGDTLPPATAKKILSQIAYIRGEVPTFVRDGRPIAIDTDQRLQRFEELCSGKKFESAETLTAELDAAKGLIDLAPYQVIRSCIGNDISSDSIRQLLSSRNPAVYLLFWTTGRSDPFPNYDQTPVDPMLFLTALSYLSGQEKSQDSRIAAVISTSTPPRLLRKHLKELMAGKLRARDHARRTLEKIAANAKSDNLRDAIKSLDPTLVQAKP